MFLKIRKLHRKIPVLESYLWICKQTPTQMLSCAVCKTFKDTYFEEYLQTTASGGVSNNTNEVIRSVLNFFFFMIRFHKYKKAQTEYKAPKSTKKYKNTTNLRFINLRFIDLRFINLRFINLRFIDLRFIKNKKCA